MAEMSLPKARIVMVEWEDACSNGGWGTPDEYIERTRNGHLCQSVGWVVSETKKQVVLVQSRSDKGTISDTITIPRSWVRRKVRLG